MRRTRVFLTAALILVLSPGRWDARADDVESSRPGARPLIVALMADPQIAMTPETPEHVRTAMRDLSGLDHDFLAALGDLTQNDPEKYRDYQELIVRQSRVPVYALAGNADVNAGLDAYRKATGLPLHYQIYRRGIRFIFLSATELDGATRHLCALGRKQVEWLSKELAEDPDATTIILSHAPLQDTTWRSGDRSKESFPGSMYLKESAEVRAMLRRHRNVLIYAHGHLHHEYGLKDEEGRGEYYEEEGVLHISVGATANNQGSVILHVFTDRIEAHVRDHQQGVFKDEFERIHWSPTTLDSAIIMNAVPPGREGP